MSCLLFCAFLGLAVTTNALSHNKIHGPKSLNDAIVVIGGGISSIHMASLLKQKGYTNVTILVDGSRLGGEDVYSRRHRGTIHEMGRHTSIPATFSDKMDQFTSLLGRGQMREVSLPTVWNKGAQNQTEESTVGDYMQKMLKMKFANLNDNQLRDKMMELLQRFGDEIKGLVGNPDDDDDMFDEPSWQNKFQLEGSVKDFLERRNLDGLKPIFTYLFGSMGFGRMDDIPLYYAIFFFKPKMLQGLRQKLQNNVGLRGIPGFKMFSDGIESLLEAAVQRNQLNVKRNVRIDDIEIRGHGHLTSKHHIQMHVNGNQEYGYYDFIVFTDDLKKYVARNRDRTQREYQQFLRPKTKYVIKTLVDSLNVPRGSTPIDFYADTLQSPGSKDYQLVFSVDSYGTRNGRSGQQYKQNLFGNTDDPNDQNRSMKSAVYTQISDNEPNVAQANSRLLSHLRSVGGTDLNVIETKIYKFFPCYTDRDLNNGMMYEILKMQGTNGVWYTGKSVFLDSLVHMMGYNSMLVNKFQTA